tara:strand:- start:1517 stop:1738 length:222 start_codon:yes stop_codon:yes gene_type:complete
MKKLFLTFGMLFATSFMMNADINNKANDIMAPNCFEQADAISTAFGLLLNMDFESEFELFEAVYDACIASGQN